MFTFLFWKAVFERAVKTFCESFASAIVLNATGVIDADWLGALSVAGLATLVAVLLNIATSIGSGNPSVGNVEKLG